MTPNPVADHAMEGIAARSTNAIQTLLSATSSREGDVAGAIDGLGAAWTARVLVDEILFRACLDDLRDPSGSSASLTIVLVHKGQDFAVRLTVAPSGVTVKEMTVDRADRLSSPRVIQEMGEVATALFGPAESVSALTRTIQWPGPEVVFPTPERPSLPTVFYAVAQRVVQVLNRGEPVDLAELSVRYGSDKWGALHQYPRHYERHFAPLRDRRLTILEIGIGGFDDAALGGASMRMWKRYFPRALVYGIDILDKSPLDAARMTTILADQSDAEQMSKVGERFGPFDIVIDDGSHVSRHVLTTFRALFPHVRRDGLYVIEDLSASYWPEHFEGDDTNLNDPNYTVGYLKTLVDGLHYEEFLRAEARAPQPTDEQVSSVHLYKNMAVIEKGPNMEGSLVASLLREERRGQP